jgi:methylenetetrahydrofolate dehydrogenase (NADP+) / methenyltetrahydrofolate cyclohydrolase
MILMEGKIAAQAVKDQLREALVNGKSTARAPHLAAILVGSNGASETYVASKIKNCAEIGFESSLIRLPETVTESELLNEIQRANQATEIDGILVQLPLPSHINESKILLAINPEKDVDGFHPVNAGNLMLGLPSFVPATPYGIMLMLEHYGVETSGKHAVIIGRSNIVGRPMSVLLSGNHRFGNCTVTVCHSKTKNLSSFTKTADIIVAALGKPGFLTGEMVKDDVVVIDVGITRVSDSTKKSGFSIQGDVHFESVAPKASYITPVPGGVGLMTIAALLKNTYQAFLSRSGNE